MSSTLSFLSRDVSVQTDQAAGATVSARTASDGALQVDDGAWILGAGFARSGHDLLVEGRDGERLFIEDYFADAEPADLALGQEGVLRGALVARLAGPQAPGQVAQLDAGATGGELIGEVTTIAGDCWVTRSDGSRVPLGEGGAIALHDVVETAPGASVGITFVDGTAFSLAGDARMVIDEMVYDPGSNANSASFSLVQGLFTMVSGDVAKSGEMTIETPVSTIGIRGTSVAIQAATEGLQNLITLLQDPDGNVGIVEVATAVARVILDTVGATTSVTSANEPPSAVEILQGTEIETLYQAALATMQTMRGSGLGTRDTPGGDAPPENGDGEAEGEGDSSDATDEDVEAFSQAIVDLFEALANELDEEGEDGEEDDEEVAVATTSSGTDDDDDDDDDASFGGRDDDDTPPPASDSGSAPADDPVNVDSSVETFVAGNNDAYLGGFFAELGISSNGTMGTTSAMPSTFGADSALPRSNLSVFFDPDGVDSGTPQSGDAFLPGTSVETFTIGFTDGGGSFVNGNHNAGFGTGVPMSYDSISTTATSASVHSSGGVSGRMEVEQTVTLGGADSFYTTSVTLTNVSGGTMSNVRYMRNNDPDHDVDPGGSFDTINDVLSNPNSPGIAAVNAQGPSGGQNLLMLADQTANNDDNGLAQDTIEVRASAFGFENTNPFASQAFSNPADPNGATDDIGINLVFAIGSLAAGQSVTFSWITSANAATDGNDYMMALQGQTTLDGGAGNDFIYASQDGTAETLTGGAGDDYLAARSSGASAVDRLVGGAGSDVLVSGAGKDMMTGSAGADAFAYNSSDDLFSVATNTTFSGSGGWADVITDFASGTDGFRFDSQGFGNLAPGTLTNGVNFSVINGAYDGTNAGTNLNHGLGQASFVYSKADQRLYFDDNGSGAGYQAVADTAQMSAGDIDITGTALA